MKFEAHAHSKGEDHTWEIQEKSFSPITCAIPQEFGGSGEGYSPEGLFALSITTCSIAAFKYACDKHKVSYRTLDAKVKATLNHDATLNQTLVTHIEIVFTVTGSSNKEKCQLLLENAINTCPISNSIKAGKTYHLNVS
jgi:organic hydroperoxide reductase OsmC/OhrA